MAGTHAELAVAATEATALLLGQCGGQTWSVIDTDIDTDTDTDRDTEIRFGMVNKHSIKHSTQISNLISLLTAAFCIGYFILYSKNYLYQVSYKSNTKFMVLNLCTFVFS